MPAVVSAVAAVASAFSGSFSIGSFLLKAAFSIGSKLVMGALSKKPKAPDRPSFGQVATDRTVTVREPVSEWPVIDGAVRAGGVIVHVEATGGSNEYMHLVIALAGHQVAAIGTLYFDGVPVPVDGNGNATGDYANFAFVERNLGTPDQEAFPDLVAKSAKWTAAHRLRGRACVHVRLKHSNDKFPNGVPNITFDVDGKLVYDPRNSGVAISTSSDGGSGLAMITTVTAHGLAAGDRLFIRGHGGADPALVGDYYVQEVVDATNVRIFIGAGRTLATGGTGGTATRMVFADNPALAVASYIVDREYGLGADFDEEVDEADLIAAANICDEEVAVTEVAAEFTADADTDECTMAEPITLVLGDRVTVSSSGTLPAGLSPGDYFVRPTGADTFKLAVSRQDALDRIFVTITDGGTGTHTVTRKTEPRHTARGVVKLDEEPQEIIGAINAAMAGIVPYVGGTFHVLAGAWRPPTVTLDEGDLRQGDFEVLTTVSRREAFNAVKGVYTAPHNKWQPADYPAVTNGTYQAEDGEQVWHELDLAYVTSPTTAQRLARIEVERGRQEITVPKMRCKLAAYTVQVGDVINLTNSRFGWSAKPFEVVESTLAFEEDPSGNPLLGVDLALRETAAAVWDWAAGQETTTDPAPNTNLPDPTPTPPTNIRVTENPFTIEAAVTVSWDPPGNAFVTEYQVEYRRTSDNTWTVAGRTDATSFEIGRLAPDWYLFRTASLNDLGALSGYLTSPETEVRVPEVMPRVSGLELRGNGANSDEFTGRDAKFVWREASQTRSHELGSEPQGGDSGACDLYFRDYEVRLHDGGGNHLRTEHTLNPWYDYTFEKNAEDGGGTPNRTFTVEVYQRGQQNQVSDRPARMTVSNPAPDLPTNLSVTAAFRHIFITYTQPADLDWQGMLVWRSGTSGFSPEGTEPGEGNCVHAGPETNIVLDAVPAMTYYLRVAPFDAFGKTELNHSAEYTVVTGTLGAADIGAGAVETQHIASAAITGAQIATAAVDTAHIANAAVESAQIASAAILSAHLANAIITDAHIERYILGKSGTAWPGAPDDGEVYYRTDLQRAYRHQADKYSTGTVAVTGGSKTVTGTGTTWLANGVAGGDFVVVDGYRCEIDTVDSETQITLLADYPGTTRSGKSYQIDVWWPVDFLSRTERVADNIITSAKIVDLVASKIMAGTITAGGIYLGGNEFELDGANKKIVIFDDQTTPVKRVELGKTGPSSYEYGMKIWDKDGNVLVDLDGFGDEVIKTVNIDPNAVTNAVDTTDGGGTYGAFTGTWPDCVATVHDVETAVLNVGSASAFVDIRVFFEIKDVSTGSGCSLLNTQFRLLRDSLVVSDWEVITGFGKSDWATVSRVFNAGSGNSGNITVKLQVKAYGGLGCTSCGVWKFQIQNSRLRVAEPLR